ncbi:hypothetical protein [Streptomyces prunicolor]|uniref:hypothetical protein n=1 Tax=Streptomyces prunicolor TaxID=67348 RepID=UPI00035E2073|nr:hypothetical protein [Streptomyces prunicolor]
MREIADIAGGFPTAVFTAVLVLLVGLWLLVLLGTAGRDSSYDAVSLPVVAASSAVVVMSWFLCVSGSLVLRGVGLPAPWHTLTASAVLIGSPALAFKIARRVTRVWRDRPARSREPGSPDRHRT